MSGSSGVRASVREIWSLYVREAAEARRSLRRAWEDKTFEVASLRYSRDDRRCEGAFIANDFHLGQPINLLPDRPFVLLRFTLLDDECSSDTVKNIFQIQKKLHDHDNDFDVDREEEEKEEYVEEKEQGTAAEQTILEVRDINTKAERSSVTILANSYGNFYAKTIALLRRAEVPLCDAHSLIQGKRLRRIDRHAIQLSS